MKNYGVFGFPIKQSFSPQYFAQKFKTLGISDCTYRAFEAGDMQTLKDVVLREKLDGFNVTIPHKQNIIPCLHSISDAAIKMNAVNTVTVKNGKWHGDNTDYEGFGKSIRSLMNANTKKALIFGTGGSSLAVRYALRQMGIHYACVSRREGTDFTYETLTATDIEDHLLLINTTPLGMAPLLEESVPIPYEAIGSNHLCYDLVYTPEETAFLKKAKMQGSKIKSGLQMLEIQADKSWSIWNS